MAGSPQAQAQFHTTHWSVVLAAGQDSSPAARDALDRLCRTYWYPLYAYVRRSGRGAHEAEDLTQEFFARLLRKDFPAGIKPEGGKFRSYLLAALKNFLVNEWTSSQTVKRGSGKTILSRGLGCARRGTNRSLQIRRRRIGSLGLSFPLR